MAFVPFYLIAGGTGAADVNAGSTTGAAAYGSTSGNWSTATNIFTPTDGSTPASTVSVGDYASVYVNGGTVTAYVAQVTGVAAGVNGGITLSSTIVYGTAPTTNNGSRSLKVGGAWATEQVLAAGGLAAASMPQSTKVNCKGNLTLTASRAITMAGTTTAPLWFSGYVTTPGDLDNDTTNSLTKPAWTLNATFSLSVSGAHQLWTGLSIVGNISGAALVVGAGGLKFGRMRVSNTSANAAATAVNCSNLTTTSFAYCYFKSPSTGATNGTVYNFGSNTFFVGCTFDTGGKAGADAVGSAPAVFVECVFLSNVVGILATTASIRAINCTFYNCPDSIKWTAAAASSHVVACLFSTSTNGINNALGTNVNTIQRYANDYYSVTNTEVGLGDSPAFFGQTDSSDPLTSASNLTPVTGANARANGFPGIFENESFSSFVNIGAVQQVAASSSVGMFIQ